MDLGLGSPRRMDRRPNGQGASRDHRDLGGDDGEGTLEVPLGAERAVTSSNRMSPS
jgi:hypothetical protein